MNAAGNKTWALYNTTQYRRPDHMTKMPAVINLKRLFRLFKLKVIVLVCRSSRASSIDCRHSSAIAILISRYLLLWFDRNALRCFLPKKISFLTSNFNQNDIEACCEMSRWCDKIGMIARLIVISVHSLRMARENRRYNSETGIIITWRYRALIESVHGDIYFHSVKT